MYGRGTGVVPRQLGRLGARELGVLPQAGDLGTAGGRRPENDLLELELGKGGVLPVRSGG